MVEAELAFYAFLYWFVPAGLIVAALVYAAYVAFDARERRAEIARQPKAAGPDPIEEMRRLHDLQSVNLAEGRASLEKAREALRRGLKG